MFEGISLVSFTPSALLGLTVYLILTGRLWSNRAHKEKSDESERWRLAYEKEREARILSESQTGELLELAKTTHAVITGMFVSTEHILNKRSGEPDALSKT